MLKGKNDKQQENRQLGFKLKFSRLEVFYKFKRLASRIEKNFTVLPFWKSGLIWLAITSMIGITIITTLIIGKNYLRLPQSIPLLYSAIERDWRSVPKIFLFSIPLLSIILGIINIQLLQKVYYMNKRLTLTICVILTVTYFLEFLAVNEILIICTS